MINLADILLPYQKQFISAPQKRKLWLSGRQLGKSFALSYLAVWKALSNKNGLSLCISTGSRAASELVKKCEKFAAAAKALSRGAIDYTCSADSVKFVNGSRVISLPSGNPSALRGWTANCIVLDECAFLERPYEVWQAIVPTLTRDKNAELVVASTPAGKTGLFWDLYSKREEGWYIQTTTAEDAKRQGLQIDIEQLIQMANDIEVFEREYMCKFADQWSSMVDISLLDIVDSLPCTPAARWLGIDIGSTSDRTAMVTLAECNGIMFIEDIVVMHKASYESQLQMAETLHKKYSYTAGYVDSNGIGSALAEFIQKKVSSKIRPYTWTAANKTPAYEHLRAQVFDHTLHFLAKDEALVKADFQNVHREVSENGRVTFSAGRDTNGHSDVTSAIVLALQAAKDSPSSIQLPTAWAYPSRFAM